MGVWNAIECWFLQRLVLGIRSSVGTLALPLRPLYSNISLLSFLLFLRDSHFNCRNGFYSADKFSLFELNVQNKLRSRECNSSTGFLIWERLIWEDMRGTDAEWKAIRTRQHWRAPGQRWRDSVSSTNHNFTHIHVEYMKFSELKDKE